MIRNNTRKLLRKVRFHNDPLLRPRNLGIHCLSLPDNLLSIKWRFSKMFSHSSISHPPQFPGAPPIVVVLGSTASGKSKLAIDLAKQVEGEVISADSMQVYEGLDILTNKATAEEMEGIPHHMISVVDRREKFDVVKFRNMALPLVEDLLVRGKVPLIVGGTNYYIESLLWKVLVDEAPPAPPESVELSREQDAKRPKVDTEDTLGAILTFMKERGGNFEDEEMTSFWSVADLHAALKEVDPARALKLHPNDVRKVVRSLQVYHRTGKKHSDIIDQQCSVPPASRSSDDDNESGAADGATGDTRTPPSLTPKLGGPMRFPNVICFWIQCERSILNSRIDNRVGKMVEKGLKGELDDFVDHVMEKNQDWEKGQLQAIGVKEFEQYILLPADKRDTDVGHKAFEEGLGRLKIVTRQYAKRQVQWISQRFLKSSRRQLPIVYGLDGSKTDDVFWNDNVTRPATEILLAHIRNKESPLQVQLLVKAQEDGDIEGDFSSRTCDICNRILLGTKSWNEHMKSAKHWKVVKRKNREKEREKMLLEKTASTQTSLSEHEQPSC